TAAPSRNGFGATSNRTPVSSCGSGSDDTGTASTVRYTPRSVAAYSPPSRPTTRRHTAYPPPPSHVSPPPPHVCPPPHTAPPHPCDVSATATHVWPPSNDAATVPRSGAVPPTTCLIPT